MDVSLHCESLSSACGSIDNDIAIFTLVELFTELFTTILKHLILPDGCIKDILKEEVPFTIIEVVVGLNFNAFLCLVSRESFQVVTLCS